MNNEEIRTKLISENWEFSDYDKFSQKITKVINGKSVSLLFPLQENPKRLKDVLDSINVIDNSSISDNEEQPQNIIEEDDGSNPSLDQSGDLKELSLYKNKSIEKTFEDCAGISEEIAGNKLLENKPLDGNPSNNFEVVDKNKRSLHKLDIDVTNIQRDSTGKIIYSMVKSQLKDSVKLQHLQDGLNKRWEQHRREKETEYDDEMVTLKNEIKNNSFIKIKSNPTGYKGDYNANSVANTRHLKRILVALEEYVVMTYSEIADITRLKVSLTDALLFLTKNKLVHKFQNSTYHPGISTNSIMYYLPKNELRAKGMYNDRKLITKREELKLKLFNFDDDNIIDRISIKKDSNSSNEDNIVERRYEK